MNTKPRKLHAASIKRLSIEVAEIAGWLAARAVPIGRSSDFLDDGRKGTDYTALRRGGNDATGPERAAMRGRSDDVGRMAADFEETLERLRRDGARLARLTRAILVISDRWHADARKLRTLGVKLAVEWDDASLAAAEGVARRSVEAAGSGDCANCGRVVSGSRVDRLRSGRCVACAVYYARNKVERPRALWGGDSIDDRCVNVRTLHGMDSRCVLTVGHVEPCSWPERIVA